MIDECGLPPLNSGTKFLIGFTGESSKFRITFDRNDILSEVYKKIRTIEMNRQSLVKKNFSSEDLHQRKNARNSFTAGER